MKSQQSIIGHVVALSLVWAFILWAYYYLPPDILGPRGRVFGLIYIWLWWPMAIFMIWAKFRYNKRQKKDEHEDDQ